MEPEEEAGMIMKFVLDKIWINFMTNPVGGQTWYNLEDPKDNPLAPSIDSQNGALQKIEFRDPLIVKNFKWNTETKNRVDMEIIRPAFDQFYKRFRDPKTAFASYSLNKIIPIPVPPNTTWEKLVIHFLDERHVVITHKEVSKYKFPADFKRMGFGKERGNDDYDVQWGLLYLLSQFGGSLKYSDNANMEKRERNQIGKRKERLSERLIELFQIYDDPFYEYSRANGYKIKINLIPCEPDERIKRYTESNDELGIQDYLEDEAPQVFDRF